MMAKDYEVRTINGEKVFVKNIVNNFWLFNDVYIHLLDEVVVDDNLISRSLDMKNDEILPYPGADSGYILFQSKVNGEHTLSFCLVTAYKDNTITRKALEAYDEYRRWAGI